MSNEHPAEPTLRNNEHWYQDHSGNWIVRHGAPLQDANATPEMNAAGNIIPNTKVLPNEVGAHDGE